SCIAHRKGDEAALELPHPHLEHGGRAAAARQPAARLSTRAAPGGARRAPKPGLERPRTESVRAPGMTATQWRLPGAPGGRAVVAWKLQTRERSLETLTNPEPSA